MQDFTYLEDYIEYLAGILDVDGKRRSYAQVSPIKLASYDKSPISSMGKNAANAFEKKEYACLTDRQISFARNLVGKYRKQLAGKGVTLPENVADLPLRHGVRTIDRTFNITLDEDERKMVLKFPYNPSKIERLHTARNQHSCGEISWDNDKKEWQLAYTEGNIDIILKLFDDAAGLEVIPPLDKVFAEFYNPDLVKHLPTLKLTDGELEWINCSESVTDKVEKAKNQSFEAIVSLAAAMDVEIDQSVKEYLWTLHNPVIVEWLCTYSIVVPSSNLPTGEWLDNLFRLNTALNNSNWVFKLDWWNNEKTDWSKFANSAFLPRPTAARTYNLDPFDDMEVKEHIAVFDIVVGSAQTDINSYIAQDALKVVYISDIGAPGNA